MDNFGYKGNGTGGSGGGFISGSVATYAVLPSPASSHTSEIWLVTGNSGGYLSWLGVYKYPKGLYSPNASNVWEQIPLSVKVSEDTFTLLNITNWSEFIGFAPNISIGDRLIYNDIEYKNLTGTIISTSPDSDTTNWVVVGGGTADIEEAQRYTFMMCN